MYVGLDLGGTKIAAGLVDEAGRIVKRARLDTPRGDAAQLIDALEQAARQVMVKEISSVGLGAPGAVDPRGGAVEFACNLQLRNIPVALLLGRRLGVPVLLQNDANCAAIGEALAGVGRGADSLVAVTLGTGIGGGIILNGRLLTGCNDAGGEVGHMVIHGGGRLCACGRRGCWEQYASATALQRRAGCSPEELCRRVAAGDGAAGKILDDFLDDVALGVVNLVNLFQPEVLCIGGGLAGIGAELLLPPIRQALDREDYARGQRRRTRLRLSALGNDAGLVGAALLERFSAGPV